MRTRALGLVFLLSTCAHAPTAAPPGDDSFSRLVDDYFDAKFAFEPSSATGVGLHERDTLLEDRSAARIAARIAELKTFRTRFAALAGQKLTFDDAIDAEALQNQAQAELLDLETLAVWQQNPMGYAGIPGNAVDLLMKRAFAPPAERLRTVIARMGGIPALYDAARANLRTPPHEFTDLAIRMAKGSVGFFEGSVATWAHEAAGHDAALRASFDRANAAVVTATRAFADWLEKDLRPRSTGAYAIGVENFRAKLKFEEMVEEPLDKLLARGEEQLRRDYRSFVETAHAIDAHAKPDEVMKRVSSEHPTAEDLIPSVVRSIDAARSFVVAQDLVTIPSDVRPHIEETPPYARSGTFASMDTPGPYETRATEAFYYVTPVEKDWDGAHREEHLRAFNRYVLASINVHEAYPGHFLQFLYAPRFPTKTRKLVSAGTNVEGWAHYAEQMMLDAGFGGGDPKMRLAQLQEALLRDCRYVVGIKLHTQGMSVEDGAKVFVERCFQEPANAYEEARRGAYNPTYLYYTLGKLQIRELREEFLARAGGNRHDGTPLGGDRRALKAFHDAFVAQGGLPIPLVRRLLFR